MPTSSAMIFRWRLWIRPAPVQYFLNDLHRWQLQTSPPLRSESTAPESAAFFINDKFKVTPWLTLIGGVRATRFSTSSPRTRPILALATRYPHSAPPLGLPCILRSLLSSAAALTLNGTTISAAPKSFAFLPLHGERDNERQFGVTIPIHGWCLDVDNFETRAINLLDHNNIGESNIFWPITWDYALIQGWEVTLRSPNVLHHGQFHLSLFKSDCPGNLAHHRGSRLSPTDHSILWPRHSSRLSPVDHDQRNTLNVGFNGSLPGHAYASTNVYYGSGFTNGLPGEQYPGNYLPSHASVDLSLGKTFAENYTVSVTAINIANRRVQLDNSLTFGGFHWDEPRQIYGEFRYRFHF